MHLHLHLLSLLVVGISCVPHNLDRNSELVHEQDKDVASLTALKPMSEKWNHKPAGSSKISEKNQEDVQESRNMFSDVNGDRQGFRQENEQVSKNGEVISNIFNEQKHEAKADQKPHFEELTSLDVPRENIHEQIANNDGMETVSKGDKSMLNLQSAEELAGYILETGDEASVVTLLEDLLKDGQISEEEALIFVETLKSYIEEAESSPVEPEDEKIREHLLARKMEEEKAARGEADTIAMLQSLDDNVLTTNEDNESILKINAFLEGAVKEGKISERLYGHLKEALLETALEGVEEDPNYLSYNNV